MRDVKTRQNEADPVVFIDRVENERRRKDAHDLLALMKKITRQKPKMWGASIIGFGTYHYKYASGHEGDAPLTGFSPRKQSLVVYLGPGLDNPALLARLGKHKHTKGCLYINKLDDVDRGVLRELIAGSVAEMRKRYPL